MNMFNNKKGLKKKLCYENEYSYEFCFLIE